MTPIARDGDWVPSLHPSAGFAFVRSFLHSAFVTALHPLSRFFVLCLALNSALGAEDSRPAETATISPLPRLEDLLQLDVSTVSRKTERWWSAPGAIEIVSDEDIRRSGVTSLPDALRLATGVHVGQLNETTWAVGVRGFSIVASNKINVQMDGRNLFTPFFSGVLWGSQDTMLEDIDRIEVVRGASGALWGPFAVNGFIQIITKPAWETQGVLVSSGVGDRSQAFTSARYGGRIGDSTFYRSYFKYRVADLTEPAVGSDPRGAADFAQAGFRSDTRVDPDTTFTLQGDVFTDRATPETYRPESRFGANLSARWQRFLSFDSDVQAGLCYDYTEHTFGGVFDETRHTVSFNGKYHRTAGAHDLQAGVDLLASRDEIVSGLGATLEPPRRTYTSAGLFVQDSISLVPSRLVFTLGGRGEYTGFSGFELSPTARLAWTPDDRSTVWAAVSRATRPPVRIDEDLVSRAGPVLVFEGNDDFEPEEVLAREVGVRRKLTRNLGVDLTGFINDYDRVRSYEPVSGSSIPYTFKNTLGARSVGVGATVFYQPFSRLFFKAGYRHMDFDLTRDPGSGDILNGVFDANDAEHLFTLAARADLTRTVEFDLAYRYVSDLPNPAVPAYSSIDARIAWHPGPEWEFALVGRNLLQPSHPEFAAINISPREEVVRSFLFKVTWRH